MICGSVLERDDRFKKKGLEPGVVRHTYSPSTQEAGAGVQGQPALQSEALSGQDRARGRNGE